MNSEVPASSMRTTAFFTAAIATLMAFPGLASTKPAPTAQGFQKKLNKDQQVLHALDRLTFGPRPGDVDRLKKQGLKKWIDLQLHPERIALNHALEAQLEPLESLRMTPLEAFQHYPPPQMIRAIVQGKQPMPDDPLLRARIEQVIARYKAKNGEASAPDAELEAIRPLEEVLTPAELEIVRGGNAEQKGQMLASMQPDRVEDMLIAMTQRQRLPLFGPAPSSIREKSCC